MQEVRAQTSDRGHPNVPPVLLQRRRGAKDRREWGGTWGPNLHTHTHTTEKAVLVPGKSHGRKGLVGYSPWGHKELDMT